MDVDVAEAERWAPFLAECIAVAAGYTSHPSSDKDAPRRLVSFAGAQGGSIRDLAVGPSELQTCVIGGRGFGRDGRGGTAPS
jgi:hypothetical protein